MIGVYNYSVLFTLLGTVSGILGIRFAILGNITAAIISLMICGFFDMFDGFVARTIKNRTEFERHYGMQLDSLSDVICFGLLPTLIGFSVLQSHPYLAPFCLIYFVAAISRLTYFNVEEELRLKKENKVRSFYTGLPVTPSALIVPAFFLMKSFTGDLFPYCFLIGLLLLAGLQVSKLKVPHLKMKGLLICLTVGVLILLTVVILNFL